MRTLLLRLCSSNKTSTVPFVVVQSLFHSTPSLLSDILQEPIRSVVTSVPLISKRGDHCDLLLYPIWNRNGIGTPIYDHNNRLFRHSSDS